MTQTSMERAAELVHVFATETQFVQTCMDELGITTGTYADMSDTEKGEFMAYMKKRRGHSHIKPGV